MKQKTAANLAAKIATEILTTNDGKTLCHRVQLMSGSYPHNEKSEGGLCRSALEKITVKHLRMAAMPNGQAEPTPTCDEQ